MVLFLSCSGKEEGGRGENVSILFEQSVRELLETTARIKNAKDTFEIDSISKSFEKRFTDINFSVPPETDFKLTEEENDSIFFLLKKMNETKKERLTQLREIIVEDTIENKESRQ